MKQIKGLLCAAVLLGTVGVSAEAPQGLIDSSRHMMDYLHEVESKLISDQKKLNDGFGDLMNGAETLVTNISDFRKEMERQQVLLDLHSVWHDKQFREPVLYSIAQVNLAVDDIATAQLDDIRALELKRRAALRELIGLVGTVHRNQSKLLDYIADDSASRRLGELNVSVLAASVAEAKILRNTLNGVVDEEVSVAEEQEELQRAIDKLQRILDRAGR